VVEGRVAGERSVRGTVEEEEKRKRGSYPGGKNKVFQKKGSSLTEKKKVESRPKGKRGGKRRGVGHPNQKGRSISFRTQPSGKEKLRVRRKNVESFIIVLNSIGGEERGKDKKCTLTSFEEARKEQVMGLKYTTTGEKGSKNLVGRRNSRLRLITVAIGKGEKEGEKRIQTAREEYPTFQVRKRHSGLG